jgi:hypothetical protein
MTILRRLLQDATSPKTTAGERLQILKYVKVRAEKLADKNRVAGDETAREFLDGPSLTPPFSLFSSSVNIMPETNGSIEMRITKEAEVVDEILKEVTETPAPPEETKPVSFPRRLEDVDLNQLAAERSLQSKRASTKPKQ